QTRQPQRLVGLLRVLESDRSGPAVGRARAQPELVEDRPDELPERERAGRTSVELRLGRLPERIAGRIVDARVGASQRLALLLDGQVLDAGRNLVRPLDQLGKD